MSETTTTNKAIGFLNLWRIPQLSVSYETLVQIANDAGFPLDYVPQPKKKRGAWEEATNLGAGGLKVNPPAYMVEQVERQYGVKPTVKLHTEVISKAAPVLIRHIVRTVTIPTNRDNGDKRVLANTQLDSRTVCIMQFDCTTETAISTGKELGDDRGFVNGNLQQIVQELHNRVDLAMNYADEDGVRNGVRDFLLSRGAILTNSGGAYFVPVDEANRITGELKSLKVYLEGLAEYVTGQKDGKQDRPSLWVIPVSDDPQNLDLFDLRLDIATEASNNFATRINKLMGELEPLLSGQTSENVAGNIKARVNSEFDQLTEYIGRYRILLNDNLTSLDRTLETARSLMDKANGTNSFRLPKSKRGLEVSQVDETLPLERANRGLTETDVVIEEVINTGKRSKRSL